MKIPPPSGEIALLALGANLGDPLEQVRGAVRGLQPHLSDMAVSAAYRTAPEGGADQPDYVNAVVRGIWPKSARELLELAQQLEASAGRERSYQGAARTLDVDVLFLGDLVMDEPGLRVPHPRWSQRAFVVVPLLDVAPDWVDPVSGRPVAAVASAQGWVPGTLERVLSPLGLASLETA